MSKVKDLKQPVVPRIDIDKALTSQKKTKSKHKLLSNDKGEGTKASADKEKKAQAIIPDIVKKQEERQSDAAQQESMRKREKLKEALIKKLMSKYQPGIKDSKTEQLIRSEVDRLLSKPKVAEKDLQEVENKVRKQSNEEISWITSNPFKRVTVFRAGANDEWALMNAKVVEAGLTEEQRAQEDQKRRKDNFRRMLDEQISEQNARRQADREARMRESGQVVADVQAYIQAMDKKKAEQTILFEKLRRAREEEVEAVRKRQERLEQQKKEEERREIERVKKQQQEEMEKNQMKRKEAQEKLKLWKLENDKNLQLKEEIKQKQMQEDMEFARKAQRALDEKEEKRLEELRKLAEKMKARERYGQELGEKLDARAREDEARMLKIQEEARLRAEAQHQERIKREHQKKIEIKETLDRQVEEMNRRKEVEKHLIARQSEIFRQQAQEAAMDEQRRLQARKRDQEIYRMQLEDQLRLDAKLRPARDLMMTEVWIGQRGEVGGWEGEERKNGTSCWKEEGTVRTWRQKGTSGSDAICSLAGGEEAEQKLSTALRGSRVVEQ